MLLNGLSYLHGLEWHKLIAEELCLWQNGRRGPKLIRQPVGPNRRRTNTETKAIVPETNNLSHCLSYEFIVLYLSPKLVPHVGDVVFTQIPGDIKPSPNLNEDTAEYWHGASLQSIKEKLGKQPKTGVARNLILFLGDGMSMATITAARIAMGQMNQLSGEEQQLSFEKFPYTGLSKTYCINSQVADSGCSGTAYLTGVKANFHTIGVTSKVALNDWRAMKNASYYTSSILQWAQEAGKGTGIVTTCKITDASPTATYAHTANRDWQSDQDIFKKDPTAYGVQDIASQLINNSPGNKLKVIMGGGRQVFLPNSTQDGYGNYGIRGDGKDLIQKWKSDKRNSNVNASYITNREQLIATDFNKTEYLLGLFHTYHLDYHLVANATLQPTLAEMTEAAIKMMQKEKDGYFLFIEGGRIDHGHHETRAHFALDEAVEFHKAIELAVRMTKEEETLIVVTADHAHTMTMNGFPKRGSNIYTTLQTADGNLSYSTLSYANGPNKNMFNADGNQHNILEDKRDDRYYTFPTTYHLSDETHDGQDVAVYARGPWAHLLTGTYEQTVIPHVMGFAARIGPAASIPSSAARSITLLCPLITILPILLSNMSR